MGEKEPEEQEEYKPANEVERYILMAYEFMNGRGFKVLIDIDDQARFKILSLEKSILPQDDLDPELNHTH